MAIPPEPKGKLGFEPFMSKPKGDLAPWPPASYRREYHVGLGESWDSSSRTCGT